MALDGRNTLFWPAPLRRAVDSIAVMLMQVYMLAESRATTILTLPGFLRYPELHPRSGSLIELESEIQHGYGCHDQSGSS